MSNEFMSKMFTGMDDMIKSNEFKEYKHDKEKLEKKFLPKGEGLSLASKRAFAEYFNKMLGVPNDKK